MLIDYKHKSPIAVHTLVVIRWIAVVAQTATVLLVYYGMGKTLPLAQCLLVISCSALANIIMHLWWRRPRFNQTEAALFIAFDIIQLSALLYLTGGIINPFVVIMLAPTTIAASMLERHYVVGLIMLATACLTLLGFYHLPLPINITYDLPAIYRFGIWIGLIIATLFLAGYAWQVAHDRIALEHALNTTQHALSSAQRLSSIGALAAAAAHNLGSPLGTIAIAAKEVLNDLPPDHPARADMELICAETNRCRSVLATLNQDPDNIDPSNQPVMTLADIARFAAERHQRDDIAFTFHADKDAQLHQNLTRTEILEGLGLLLQNAFYYAHSRVDIALNKTAAGLEIIIQDDGPGFPLSIIKRLGHAPYLSARHDDGSHMGLGVFIASGLLRQTGAALTFANAKTGGAAVSIVWPHTKDT